MTFESRIDERDALWKKLSYDASPARSDVASLATLNKDVRAAFASQLCTEKLEIARCNLCEVFTERLGNELLGRITDRGMVPALKAAAQFIDANSRPSVQEIPPDGFVQ